MPERGVRRRDEAATDMVGTVLLVALVVVLGSLLLLIVADTLETPVPPRATFSIVAAEAGSGTAQVLYRNGEPIPVSDLRVGYQRNDTNEATPTSVVTPDAETLHPGDRISFPVVPPLAPDERITIRLYSRSSNVMLTEISARAGGSALALPEATMTLGLSVGALPNDSASASLLTARVSHPHGGLSVARVVADLSNLSAAGATAGFVLPLNDEGLDGDIVGGDGVWSATLRIPTTTAGGSYVFTVNATDSAGRLAATATRPITVTQSMWWAAVGAANTVIGYGNVTGGSCWNCTVLGGFRTYEGTRFIVPPSNQTSALRLTNFTYDRLRPQLLEDDAFVFRITDVNNTFSCHLTFGYGTTNDIPSVKTMRLWTNGNETTYKPRVGSYVPLANLTLDLLNPVATQQWIYASGNPDGTAYYTKAKVTQPATLIIAFMRDTSATASKDESLDVGIFAADVVIY